MPIKACADKLTADIELFGTNFERYEQEDDINDEIAKKKSKAIGKTVKMKFQFQIMRALGTQRRHPPFRRPGSLAAILPSGLHT